MISDEEYKKLLKQFHKLSDRHILVVETNMSSSDIQKCINEFENCHNKEKALIEWIKTNKIKVLNSGIKIA